MQESLEFYKELFREIIFINKREEVDRFLSELEDVPEQKDLDEKLLSEIESFSKPYPMPLYWFSLLRMFKLILTLRKRLSKNYDFYFNIYNQLRKKENRNEDENRLFNEISEILYRIDELNGKIERIIPDMILEIKKNIKKEYKDEKFSEQFFLAKVDKEAYENVYSLYEELIETILTLGDELKLEEGLFKLSQLLLEESRLEIKKPEES